eukprot:SAG31_NODE_7927_length_1563_cov_0.661885_2_plen_386_part_01
MSALTNAGAAGRAAYWAPPECMLGVVLPDRVRLADKKAAALFFPLDVLAKNYRGAGSRPPSRELQLQVKSDDLESTIVGCKLRSAAYCTATSTMVADVVARQPWSAAAQPQAPMAKTDDAPATMPAASKYWTPRAMAISRADLLELLFNATANEFPKLQQMISSQAPTFNPPNTIYSVAAVVYPLLEAAARSKNVIYIDSLCSLLVSANASLRPIRAATVHDIGTFNYSTSVRVWRSPGPDGQEDVLSSSQFLYGVARAASAVASLPTRKRTPAMLRLLRFTREHAWSTYRRWVWPVPGQGLFEMKGYGCPAGHVRGNGLADKAYGHAEFLRLLLSRSFQGPPVFCNAVSDVDLWMIAATTELLAVHSAGLLPLPAQQLSQLQQYV